MILKNKPTLKAIHLGVCELFLDWKRRKDSLLSPPTTAPSESTKNHRQGARKERKKTEWD